jgi:outer membrane protein OmpA-like peptidoglycan-associated protein
MALATAAKSRTIHACFYRSSNKGITSMSIRALGTLCLSLLATVAIGQGFEKDAAVISEEVANLIPVYSYRVGPESRLQFRSTALVPASDGDGEVEYQDGRARVRVNVRKLPATAQLGPYTVYILWAITMEGRASNLGFFPLRDGRAELNTSVPLAQFALIVTAEPHFAVTVPSKSVVLRNFVDNVQGRQDTVRALKERADYATLARQTDNPRKRVPVELIQARYAMAIANSVAAPVYAAAAFAKADQLSKLAEAAQISKKSSERRTVAQTARNAVQAAEDARREALVAKAVAEQTAREDQQRTAREAVVQDEKRVAAEKAAADLKQREVVLQEESRKAADLAAAAAATQATAKARADLTERLNRVLPTTDTPRGLVAQISGVQFASGTATLNSGARESLARFSGIVVAYSDMRFIVEGHTDNVGKEAANMALSLKRAITVRDYLIAQEVPASAIDVKGMGSSSPAADNAGAAGRAANRRVEIVMSGGPIGAR